MENDDIVVDNLESILQSAQGSREGQSAAANGETAADPEKSRTLGEDLPPETEGDQYVPSTDDFWQENVADAQPQSGDLADAGKLASEQPKAGKQSIEGEPTLAGNDAQAMQQSGLEEQNGQEELLAEAQEPEQEGELQLGLPGSDLGADLTEREGTEEEPTDSSSSAAAAIDFTKPRNVARPASRSERAKAITKKIFLGIYYVVFGVFILIYKLIRHCIERRREVRFEQEGKHGASLILATDPNNLKELSGFELYELVKSVYFYDGYRVESVETKKSFSYLFAQKGEERLLIKVVGKGKALAKRQVRFEKGLPKEGFKLCLATLADVKEDARQEMESLKVLLIGREQLEEKLENAKQIIAQRDYALSARQDLDIEQRFPFMI